MNCHEVIPLLSTFHDGEFAPDKRRAIAEHIASCTACSQRLESMRRLSDLVAATPAPATPGDMLHKIENSLATASISLWNWSSFSVSRRSVVAAMLATATALIAGLIFWQFFSQPHDHREMVRVFGEFLDAYEQGRPDAEDLLAQKYHGGLITEAEATATLKRKTVARPIVLANHKVSKRYLLKMPCCDCVQTIYSREGITSFVLFEHEKEQTEWFNARPMIRAECRGKTCCLVQLSGAVAATWPVDGGFVTAIGLRDVAEFGNLVDELQPL
jgi:hypothetical protein